MTRRLLALTCIVLLLFCTLSPLLSPHHDCTGENCALCFCLQSAKDLWGGIFLSTGLLAMGDILRRVLPDTGKSGLIFKTPVTQKVKLSD